MKDSKGIYANIDMINNYSKGHVAFEETDVVIVALMRAITEDSVEEIRDPSGITFLCFPQDDEHDVQIARGDIVPQMHGYLNHCIDLIKNNIKTYKQDGRVFTSLFILSDFFASESDLVKNSSSEQYFYDVLKAISKHYNNPQNDPNGTLKKYMSNNLLAISNKAKKTSYSKKSIDNVATTLLKYNLVDIERLSSGSFFDRYSVSELMDLSKQGIIEKQDLLSLISVERYKDCLINAQESLLFWQSQKEQTESDYSEKEIKTNIRKYEKEISFLASVNNNDSILVDLYTSDELDKNFFAKMCDRISLANLSSEQIVPLLYSNCGDKIKTSSGQLLNLYGTHLSGEDCISLAYINRIKPQELIDIAGYDSIKVTSPDKAVYFPDLLDFYVSDDSSILYNMYKNGNLDEEFSKKFRALVDKCEDDIGKEVTYKNIVLGLRRKSQEAQENPEKTITDFYKVGLVPAESLKGFVSHPFIEDMYVNEELTDDDLLAFVKSNVITKKASTTFLSDDEIIAKVMSGEFDPQYLKLLDPTTAEKLDELFYEDKCPIDIFMKSYLEYDIISTKRINELFEIKKPEEDLSQFITPESDKQKIKDLFTNYHISYEDLSVLLHSEIITQEEFDDIKQAINKADFYKRLRETDKVSLQSDDKNAPSTGSRGPNPGKDKTAKTDFNMEKKAFEDIFDTPRFNRDNIPYIESYNIATGRPTTLNNYLIIPIEKYGLVAFEKFESENALYVMPYQQADYFLHGHMDLLNPSDFRNQVHSLFHDPKFRSKKTLHEMDSVKIINHTKHFWKNAIDAMTELSEEARQDLKPNGKYTPTVKNYIDNMRERYNYNSEEMK